MAANKNALRLGFKKFSDKLAKKIVEVKSKKITDELGEFIVDLIRKRVRLGYGITKNKDGQKVRFPALSEKYVDYRKKHRRDLDETTSAKKSNVTFTGQLLRSLGYRRKGNSGVIVQVSGRRREGGTNEDVALELLNKRNRRFIGLTQSEERQVARFYRQQFGKVIKRRN